MATAIKIGTCNRNKIMVYIKICVHTIVYTVYTVALKIVDNET